MNFGEPGRGHQGDWTLGLDRARPIFERAIELGLFYFDCADVYGIGACEEVVGKLLRELLPREQYVLATKVAMPMGAGANQRGLSRKHILEGVDRSLERLGVDYVDHLVIHRHPHGVPGHCEVPIEETLEALDSVVQAGKVRWVGLSNENPWGVMRFLQGAEAGKGPRVVSVQNPYSLLNRSYETRMAEVGLREDVGLLAYAPIAAGALTGKYLDGQWPAGARRTLWPENTRYQGPQADKATAAYVSLAKDLGLDPAQLALAFVLRQPFLGAAIIGATTMAQLKTNIAAAGLSLGDDAVKALEDIHKVYTYPCP
jgi:aryl-alcohol dehydrogenase-like predicted oxidoreductase